MSILNEEVIWQSPFQNYLIHIASLTNCGYKRSLKAAQRQELSVVKTKMDFCDLRAIQGHSGGIPMEPETDELCRNSAELEEIPFPSKTFVELAVFFEKWTDFPGGKENIKPVKQSF